MLKKMRQKGFNFFHLIKTSDLYNVINLTNNVM